MPEDAEDAERMNDWQEKAERFAKIGVVLVFTAVCGVATFIAWRTLPPMWAAPITALMLATAAVFAWRARSW